MSSPVIQLSSSDPKGHLKDRQGRWRTQSLFYEYKSENYTPIFSIKDFDHKVKDIIYPSLKRIYLSYDHVPDKELSFANEVLGGWEHWIVLQENKLFSGMIAQWKFELDLRIQEQAIKALMLASKEEGGKGVAAAKYLADKGYKELRGRPSKAEVERERKIQAGAKRELEEDLERIGLHLVKAG